MKGALLKACLMFSILCLVYETADGVWFWGRRRRRRCSPSNCAVSSWSGWTGCSQACGSSGVQSRGRRVVRSASCGGSCPYGLRETRACNRKCCPVNCAWGWGNWGSCVGCGTGTRTRSVVISRNAYCGGASCPTTRSQTQSCNTGRCCPVNCVTSAWGSWGSCNAQCEKTGVRSRTKTVITPASCNGNACPGLTQYNVCNGPCCRRDCVLSSWTAWGTCNAPAGSCSPNSGKHSRSRTLITAQSCGGGCFPLQESKTCTPVPITCQVTAWGTWSTCTPKTGSCGAGTQSRTRTISRQPYCSSACPSTTDRRDCTHSCCPVNCVLSQWTAWGQCSANCGTGLQQRTRQITSSASCGGTCSSNLAQTKQCTVIQKVDCQMSAWSTWSTCSSGCGNGIQQRTRTITVQPTPCGQSCGNLTDLKQCQNYRENRDCQVSSWQTWGSCSVNCTYGTKTRFRTVTVSQRCRGSACPTLKDTGSCGAANGGCQQICRPSDGACSCMRGYESANQTHCNLKDCGTPKVDYCPAGIPKGTVCLQPWISCQNGKSTFGTSCSLSCPSTHSLKGSASISCEADGQWSQSLQRTYCKRINEPPTNIILSGTKKVAENSPSRTFIGSFSSTDVNAKDNHTYSLVTATFSAGKFVLIGNDLYTMVSFDYEAGAKSYSICIKSTDNGNPQLFMTKFFTISVEDVNEKASNIVLSSHEVAENSNTGTEIGTLDTVDVDIGQKNTYHLLDSAGGLFKITNDKLQVAAENRNCLRSGSDKCLLNFEKQSFYIIQVLSTDDKSPSFNISRQFNISITDQNDPPYDIQITRNTLNENSPIGTIIGIFTAKDEDVNPKQSYTFSLLDDDNGRFGVAKNGSLFKAKGTDYEIDKTHQIQVKVTDNGVPPASNTRNIKIIVLDDNEPPVNITLSSTGSSESYPDGKPIIPENSPIGTVIGTINAFDSDFITGLNLTLDDDAGGRFKIDGNQSCVPLPNNPEAKTVCKANLIVNGDLNYEESQSLVLTIRAEDRGHFIHRTFNVKIKDENDPPHGLIIDGKTSETVKENVKGATVGRITVLDEDRNQTHVVKLVQDYNGTFVLTNDMLSLGVNVSLDFEAKQSYDLKFDVGDNGKPSKSAIFDLTINVTNENEAPNDIQITGSSVFENSKELSLIANITVTDPDDVINQVAVNNRKYHVCTLTDSANDRFKVVDGLKLVVGSSPIDYEAAKSYSITMQCSDGALTVTKSFLINVKDVNERPTSIRISRNQIIENQSGRSLVGYLSTTDPDNQNTNRQSFTYSLSKNDSVFEVDGNALYCISPFDYEKTISVQLSVISVDDGTPPLSTQQILVLDVVDANDAPTDILISASRVDENSPMNTVVGLLSTTDEDTSQSYVYHMQDDANGRFKIEGNAVKVGCSNVQCLTVGGSHCLLNYEKNKTHVVQIRTTDSGSPQKSYIKNMKIHLNDVNDRPRDIKLSNYKVAENASINHIIGQFSASDEDKGQLFTFTLAKNDSGRFGIDASGNLYKASETNYETNKTHEITVVVRDYGSPPLESSEDFTIEVLDVNEAPIKTLIRNDGGQLNFTDNNAKVNENSKSGTVIGSIVSYDSESNETIKFKLDDDASGIFSLAGNTVCKSTKMVGARSVCSVGLLLNGPVNYEIQASYWIIVRSTDNEGLFQTEKFNVGIVDQNDEPTGVLIGGQKYAMVPENKPGTLIDRLTTIDEDAGQSHVYSIKGNSSQMYRISSSSLFLSQDTVFDYEMKSKHMVTIKSTDSGQPPKSVIETLELRVQDVNEAPTDVALNNSIVFENSPKGTLIGILSVTDPDNTGHIGTWQTHNCVVTSGGSGMMQVQGMQLVVAHNGIDYEKASSYNISIRCQDSGTPTQFMEKSFLINVQDVNEKPTSISISNNVIQENLPSNTGIGLLTTTDPDNSQSSTERPSQKFSYTILNNDTGLPFKIGKDNVLRTTRKLDYERQSAWGIRLRSYDTGIPAMFVDGLVIVNVTDVNEQPIDVSLSNTNITENCGLGTLVGFLNTSDYDAGQSFTYSLTDNAGGLFRVIGNRVETALSNGRCLSIGGDSCKFNFEKNRIMNIRVKSEDNGMPSLSFEKEISIKLTDINDKPRDIRLSANQLPENATKGYMIGQLSATDEDNGQNLTFRLLDDDNGRFALSKDNFIVKAKDTDYESSQSHRITVEVSDNGNPVLKNIKDFVIIIKDVNEAPTKIEITHEGGQLSFNKNSPRVNENSDKGTVIGTLFAYDEDLVETLTFSFDDDSNGKFAVESTATCRNASDAGKGKPYTNCKALLKVAGSLDYENMASMSIIVRVTDNNGLHHSQLFPIAIVDCNDKPTDITLNGGYVGFVNENENNAVIATLECEDEDKSQTHSYRILNDPDTNFIVSGSRLYTSPHASLNYEKQKRYTVLIESVDNGSPPMHFQKNLTVQVMDVNEAPSAIALTSNHVKENSVVGTAVANVTVTDPDNEFTYTGRQRASCSVSSDSSGIFGIKDHLTLVVMKASLDYERKSRYTIKLRCADNGTPSKSLEQSFSIIVDDVNEAPTSIMLTDGTVRENQASALVGKLVVSDPDTTRQSFTLSIQDQNSPFMISGINSLKTVGPLDFEKQYEHKISIRAVDQGGLSVVENFTIHVQDRNDPPSSIMFTGTLSIEESTSAGVVVATASAIDEDFHQTHSYSILSVVGKRHNNIKRSVQGYFAVDASNGRIRSMTSAIDYEEYVSFDIEVVATDNGVPQMNVTSTVNIKVTDVNHPPTDILFDAFSVVENSPTGTVVGNFKVVDPDNKFAIRQNFTCRLDTGTGVVVPFTVTKQNSLTVSGVVDYEQQQIYSLKITCTEIHSNPYNITKNFILSVVNVNEAPTGINMTSNTIPENRNPGFFIGTVVAVDPDNKLARVNNVTIQLLTGLDSAAFRMEAGNSLVANQTLDYEQKKVWSVRIRATDNGIPNLSSEKNIDIMILDMNDRPTDISLSGSVISENANTATIIGQFATVDQDKGQSHAYSFINTVSNLAINGDKLAVSGNLDFENEPVIFITVQVTDSGSPSLTYQKSFNITVTDANDAPSAIVVTIYPVFENNTADKMIADIKVIDEDNTQTHSCSMLSNQGNYYSNVDAVSHNISMYIKGSVPLDFETSQSLTDKIRCYDNGSPSLYIDQQLSIPILDSNDRPTKVLINGANIVLLSENSPNDAVAGQLSCIDQDGGQSHTFYLLNENDVFKIDTELLRVKNNSKLNYETLPGNKSIPITVKCTDNGNPSLSLTTTLQVQITDVNEAPLNVRMIEPIGKQIPENTTIGTHIGELFCDNPEGFRQLITYELLNWNNVFGVTEGHGPAKVSYLTLKSELDFAKQNQYNITVKAFDNGVPQLSSQAVITVDVSRSDPCFTGELNCGGEVCQRVNKTRGNCGCLAGYELKDNKCIEIDECKANCKYCENPKKACSAKKTCLPCLNNATCHDKLLGYNCACLPGFADDRCETNIDDCISKPCKFGTCFDLINGYRCECEEGYSGRNCTVNIDECTRKECLKGDCKDLIAGFSCQCELGVFGLLCNRKVSDCEPNPCSKGLCVPPTYSDTKMVNGFKEPVCAGDTHIIELTFSNVPKDKDQLNKWKYIFRTFITTMVGIPYAAVSLSEDLSNGGIYYPTDVIMFAMKASSKTRRSNEVSNESKVVFPLVVKVNAKLVPENAFLRALNKTCLKITQSSIYFVYCDAAYSRIKALGLTGDGGNESKIDKSVGGKKFFTANNIYIIAGAAGGFVLLVAIVLMVRARKNKAAKHRQSIGNDPLVSGENNYFDAMERHLAKRVEDSYMESVNNPIYGKDDIEVERERRMFTNPLYGADSHDTEGIHDESDDPAADFDETGGICNPMYGQVAKLKGTSGDTDC